MFAQMNLRALGDHAICRMLDIQQEKGQKVIKHG
jgi:hypothetical protein